MAVQVVVSWKQADYLMSPIPLIRLRPLTPPEWHLLRRLTRAQADLVRRARTLLAVAQGYSFTAAAAFAGYHSRSTLPALVRRFNQCGVAPLAARANERDPGHADHPATG